MGDLEIFMCGKDLERGEDKKVMSGIDKAQDVYKRNKRTFSKKVRLANCWQE